MSKKIESEEELKNLIKKLRARNLKIVTTNGAFDILHVGHIKSLVEAKKYGDVLIVCLNSDNSIKEYKSKNRPINKQEDRAEMLAALEVVDYVKIFNEPDPRNLLDKIKPDFHIKSKSGFKGIEKEVIENNGGKIVLIDDIPGISTTRIIEKIKK